MNYEGASTGQPPEGGGRRFNYGGNGQPPTVFPPDISRIPREPDQSPWRAPDQSPSANQPPDTGEHQPRPFSTVRPRGGSAEADRGAGDRGDGDDPIIAAARRRVAGSFERGSGHDPDADHRRGAGRRGAGETNRTYFGPEWVGGRREYEVGGGFADSNYFVANPDQDPIAVERRFDPTRADQTIKRVAAVKTANKEASQRGGSGVTQPQDRGDIVALNRSAGELTPEDFWSPNGEAVSRYIPADGEPVLDVRLPQDVKLARSCLENVLRGLANRGKRRIKPRDLPPSMQGSMGHARLLNPLARHSADFKLPRFSRNKDKRQEEIDQWVGEQIEVFTDYAQADPNACEPGSPEQEEVLEGKCIVASIGWREGQALLAQKLKDTDRGATTKAATSYPEKAFPGLVPINHGSGGKVGPPDPKWSDKVPGVANRRVHHAARQARRERRKAGVGDPWYMGLPGVKQLVRDRRRKASIRSRREG